MCPKFYISGPLSFRIKYLFEIIFNFNQFQLYSKKRTVPTNGDVNSDNDSDLSSGSESDDDEDDDAANKEVANIESKSGAKQKGSKKKSKKNGKKAKSARKSGKAKSRKNSEEALRAEYERTLLDIYMKPIKGGPTNKRIGSAVSRGSRVGSGKPNLFKKILDDSDKKQAQKAERLFMDVTEISPLNLQASIGSLRSVGNRKPTESLTNRGKLDLYSKSLDEIKSYEKLTKSAIIRRELLSNSKISLATVNSLGGLATRPKSPYMLAYMNKELAVGARAITRAKTAAIPRFGPPNPRMTPEERAKINNRYNKINNRPIKSSTVSRIGSAGSTDGMAGALQIKSEVIDTLNQSLGAKANIKSAGNNNNSLANSFSSPSTNRIGSAKSNRIAGGLLNRSSVLPNRIGSAVASKRIGSAVSKRLGSTVANPSRLSEGPQGPNPSLIDMEDIKNNLRAENAEDVANERKIMTPTLENEDVPISSYKIESTAKSKNYQSGYEQQKADKYFDMYFKEETPKPVPATRKTVASEKKQERPKEIVANDSEKIVLASTGSETDVSEKYFNGAKTMTNSADKESEPGETNKIKNEDPNELYSDSIEKMNLEIERLKTELNEIKTEDAPKVTSNKPSSKQVTKMSIKSDPKPIRKAETKTNVKADTKSFAKTETKRSTQMDLKTTKIDDTKPIEIIETKTTTETDTNIVSEPITKTDTEKDIETQNESFPVIQNNKNENIPEDPKPTIQEDKAPDIQTQPKYEEDFYSDSIEQMNMELERLKTELNLLDEKGAVETEATPPIDETNTEVEADQKPDEEDSKDLCSDSIERMNLELERLKTELNEFENDAPPSDTNPEVESESEPAIQDDKEIAEEKETNDLDSSIDSIEQMNLEIERLRSELTQIDEDMKAKAEIKIEPDKIPSPEPIEINPKPSKTVNPISSEESTKKEDPPATKLPKTESVSTQPIETRVEYNTIPRKNPDPPSNNSSVSNRISSAAPSRTTSAVRADLYSQSISEMDEEENEFQFYITPTPVTKPTRNRVKSSALGTNKTGSEISNENKIENIQTEDKSTANPVTSRITSAVPNRITSAVPNRITSAAPNRIGSAIPNRLIKEKTDLYSESIEEMNENKIENIQTEDKSTANPVTSRITSAVPNRITSAVPNRITSAAPNRIGSAIPNRLIKEKTDLYSESIEEMNENANFDETVSEIAKSLNNPVANKSGTRNRNVLADEFEIPKPTANPSEFKNKKLPDFGVKKAPLQPATKRTVVVRRRFPGGDDDSDDDDESSEEEKPAGKPNAAIRISSAKPQFSKANSQLSARMSSTKISEDVDEDELQDFFNGGPNGVYDDTFITDPSFLATSRAAK